MRNVLSRQTDVAQALHSTPASAPRSQTRSVRPLRLQPAHPSHSLATSAAKRSPNSSQRIPAWIGAHTNHAISWNFRTTSAFRASAVKSVHQKKRHCRSQCPASSGSLSSMMLLESQRTPTAKDFSGVLPAMGRAARTIAQRTWNQKVNIRGP